MSQFKNDSIFWIEVGKIKPNPLQPRRGFDEARLRDLAESIRQYGILQPLIVTRAEKFRDDGGLIVEYELIAGERRHRAAMLAGLSQVPAIIRSGEESTQMKLEIAIIENLQREDLNPIDRARAFERLANEFRYKHMEIGKKIGKSREYVTNTIRLLTLPQKMQDAITVGKITEGHARPMMMLKDRPEEQDTLFKEVLYRKITVREAEGLARKIAFERARKKDYQYDPEIAEMEGRLSESLGTRVQIERKDIGGKIVIDYFSPDDLMAIFNMIGSSGVRMGVNQMLNKFISDTSEKESAGKIEKNEKSESDAANFDSADVVDAADAGDIYEMKNFGVIIDNDSGSDDDSILPKEEEQDDGDIYSIKNFTI